MEIKNVYGAYVASNFCVINIIIIIILNFVLLVFVSLASEYNQCI